MKILGLLAKSGDRGVSAKQLACALDCSVPTVYRRIARLKRIGTKICTKSGTSKTTGPVPKLFFLKAAL